MKRLLAVTAAACAALSCGGPVAPRTTVQADAIAKADLQGTWYYRQTVIGVPFTTGFTFIGEQGENEMEKVVWDIQEDVLTARRAYEYVKGSEKGEPSHAGPAGYQGAAVAAFRIKSHFDIIREYNPSTGEEYDKVVESQERKWYERAFVRVDWSTNLVSNFNFLADWSAPSIQPIRTDPVPYYVSDPKDPDAFRLERPDSSSAANYMEVTQKLIAQPEMVTFEDGSTWPLCFLEYTVADCASQELKVRSSFLRAEKRDYEPLVYDDKMMERFGFFSTERKSYNREYGLTEAGRSRFINRHNLWRRSLTTDECRKDADCGAAAPGRRCVTELPDALIDEKSGVVTGVCSLPYAVRNLEDPSNPASADLGPRPLVYFLNDTFPEDLKGAAKNLQDQYDAIYKGIVKQLTGKDVAGQLYVVCPNNPVKDGDPAACGPAGTHARVGDLRYSFLYWVDEPTSGGLLGYGPNSNDPETGEVISSSAFVYGASVDEYSAYARDLVRLVNGEIAPDAFISGVNVRDWLANTTFGQKAKTADVAQSAAAMNTEWAKGLPKTKAIRKGSAAAVHQMRIDRHAQLAALPSLKGEPGMVSRRLAKLHGTDVESRLVSPETLFLRGINPKAPGLVADAAKVRPLDLFNPAVRTFRAQQRRQLGAHGVDFAFLDDNILGFALAQKGKDPAEVWRKIREQVFLSTALHEVGHTMGLRHNFAGSYDPMNYPKTYWDLRTNNGTIDAHPRYVDPESDSQLKGVTLPNGLHAGISEFMQSSIMDYGANFNSDIQGLGKYDVAALKFGYGQLVEVFTDVKDPYLLGELQASVTYGEALPVFTDCTGNDFISSHYSSLPKLVSLEKRADVSAVGLVKQVVAPSCKYPDQVETDAQRRIVVPYKFCSDEFEGASTGCQAFDRGADPYEVARHYANTYRNYYVFDAFRRERLGFNPEWYLDRVYGRYLEPLRTMMQFYVLDRGYYEGAVPDTFWTAENGYGPLTQGVSDTFDLLGEMLLMPEPGEYREYLGDDGRENWYLDPYGDGPAGFTLGLSQSRYFTTEWEYDSGYFWYERLRNVGSFEDKVAALVEMVDPETYFIGKDEAADLRQFSINYWRLYPDQMMNLFTNTLTDRWDLMAPVFDTKSGYHLRPISQPIAALAPTARPVDPALGFSVQLWTASLGNGLIPLTFDPTYSDRARVWLAGNGDQISSTLPTVTYVDAEGGKTYTAVSYLVAGKEQGLGARMIARANELKALLDPKDPYTVTALRNYVQLLESQRSISAVYADPTY
ncbi:MAG: zinc-dependent metalloprotease [Myxococcaceae bacterium]|nr:zinc-dependent metalloprotease [Myxococcaceae bacterium]